MDRASISLTVTQLDAVRQYAAGCIDFDEYLSRVDLTHRRTAETEPSMSTTSVVRCCGVRGGAVD